MKVLITGASGGIGRAAAEYFLKKGHEVHGLDIREADEDLLKFSESAECCGAYYHHIADVTDKDSIRSGLPEGFLPEVLINCAGIQEGERDIDVNLKGMINVAEMLAVSNEEIKSVVNIGSASGHTGSEFPEYAASKGGVIAYTKNVALRIAPRAICNSIDPGGVTTELNRVVMDDPVLWNRIMELTPLKRWASAEEIAEWIYFVGVTNRFMTGQNLLIDGGEAGRAEFVWPE
ncbi:MAG: SDR family oxidoreductase [Mogibacterium sp.]|nr:SDR family oxidoreductase [Mogibacterium sp.]